MSTVSIDQQFVEFVIKAIVSNPDAVKVDRSVDEKGVLLELTVDPDDLGRVIGKRGATAQSVRTLLRALGTKNDARYNLKVVDNGVQRPVVAPTATAQADDSVVSDDTAAVNDAVVDEDVVVAFEKDEEGTKVSKTRKELDDLDDLEI